MLRIWAAELRRRLVGFLVGLAFVAVALLLVLGGMGFLIAALYLALLNWMSPAMAALAIGGGALLIAGLCVLLARRAARRAGRPNTAEATSSGAPDPTAALAAEALVWIHTNAVKAAAGALVAGMAIGISPRLRRALWRMLQ